jgi:hypothetical protein
MFGLQIRDDTNNDSLIRRLKYSDDCIDFFLTNTIVSPLNPLMLLKYFNLLQIRFVHAMRFTNTRSLVHTNSWKYGSQKCLEEGEISPGIEKGTG